MALQRQYSPYFYFSLGLHAVVLLALIMSVEFSSMMPVTENSNQHNNVVDAVAISSDNFMPIVKPMEPKPTLSESLPRPQPQQEVQKPKIPPRVIPVIKKPEPTKIALEKPKKMQKDLIEQQLLADIKEQEKHNKKIKPKDKKLKQQALEKAFANELKEQAAKSLQQQLANEQRKLTGLRNQQTQGVVDKYKALILQAISRRWLVPPNIDKSLVSELLIRVAPGGDVLDVVVVKSSGDLALDHSAREAVFKSSPLPVPSDADAFDQFRQFKLRVKPENILSTNSWVS